MDKNFNIWNERKKLIHRQGENRFYRERQIWWCNLGVNVGFEEDGSGELSQRPVLILRGFSRQVCLVVPLTSSHKRNPYHYPVGVIDTKESFAIISQLRLVDTKRFVNDIGTLDKIAFDNIRKAVRNLF